MREKRELRKSFVEKMVAKAVKPKKKNVFESALILLKRLFFKSGQRGRFVEKGDYGTWKRADRRGCYIGNNVTHRAKIMNDTRSETNVYPIISLACILVPAAMTGKNASVQKGWIIFVHASPYATAILHRAIN